MAVHFSEKYQTSIYMPLNVTKWLLLCHIR